MPRPVHRRAIDPELNGMSFKPLGSGRRTDSVTLSLDALEALRLADLEGLYQETAALKRIVRGGSERRGSWVRVQPGLPSPLASSQKAPPGSPVSPRKAP